MIVGTGIDIIEVSRVAEKLNKNSGFREKVFSGYECAFCDQKPNAAQHFAARFAAKEAFLKATGKGLTIGYELSQVEVVEGDLGKPEIRLSGNFETLASENGWSKIHVSLSHVREIACAVVIIEK
jgi:holo-[acyl-carrier protein] synthase